MIKICYVQLWIINSQFVCRQISQLLDESKRAPVSLQQIETQTPQRKSSVIHAPIPAPPADDMEPQNISFIGNADKISEGKNHQSYYFCKLFHKFIAKERYVIVVMC